MKIARKVDNPELFWKQRNWVVEQYGEFKPVKYHPLMTKAGWSVSMTDNKMYWTHNGVRKTELEFRKALEEIANETL